MGFVQPIFKSLIFIHYLLSSNILLKTVPNCIALQAPEAKKFVLEQRREAQEKANAGKHSINSLGFLKKVKLL